MFLHKQPIFTSAYASVYLFFITMAGAGTSDTSKSIFTNYVTSPLSTEKLNGSNYDSWAADIKLWVTGQGYKDHLTQKSDTMDKAEKPKWE